MAQRILCIVDDDPLVHFVTRKILKEFMPEENIISFSHGEEMHSFLIENANNEKKLPDIILLDINMPEMNGIEFLEKYAALKPNLYKSPNIFIISSSMNKSEIYSVKNDPNAAGFISKPLSMDKLEAILNH